MGADGQHPTPLPLDVHTEEELELVLARVSQHVGLDLAAIEIGSTATRLRRLFARDRVWQERLDEAQAQGREHYADRLKATARVIALRTDPEHVNARVLEVELATHVPGYEHLRRDRVKHEARVEHVVSIDISRLGELSDSELEVLELVLEKQAAIEHPVIEGNGRALPAA